MTLDSVHVDEDALEDVLRDLEQSFGVRFDSDLRHVRTAGDLFHELLKHRPPSGEGDRHALAMAFFLLRRTMAPLWDEQRAEPATALKDRELPAPAKLRARLERETGLSLPSPPISMFALIVAGGFATAAVMAFAVNWPIWGVALIVLGLVWLKLDRGEYSREWMTLGSLARATANLNFSVMADRGARDTEAENWRVFSEMLSEAVFAGRAPVAQRELRSATVLEFKRPAGPTVH